MAKITQKEMEEYQRLKSDKKKRYARQNQYIKDHYYRPTITLPIHYKSIIGGLEGVTVNGYINDLVRSDLMRRGLLDDTE